MADSLNSRILEFIWTRKSSLQSHAPSLSGIEGEGLMWINIDKERQDSAHYSVMRRDTAFSGMQALRDMFPEGVADELNFVLFSTSGVHGTYNTIEEAESVISGAASEDAITDVTFLIVHPRLVSLRYGECQPASLRDIEYLKCLRASSHAVVAKIGMGEEQ
jgi:hypothetical protein